MKKTQEQKDHDLWIKGMEQTQKDRVAWRKEHSETLALNKETRKILADARKLMADIRKRVSK